MIVLSTAQMKMAERLADESGVSYYQMMENAGKSAAALIRKRFAGKVSGLECLILCGNGNNGGDGFVVARLLKAFGAKVSVLLCCGVPKTADASKNYQLLEDIKQYHIHKDSAQLSELIKNAAVIVDAVFGTGFHGELPEQIAAVFAQANATVAYKLALDVPSGINADSGERAENCFFASQTISFAVPKPAHILPHLQQYFGQIVISDIGITEEIIRRAKEIPDYLSETAVLRMLPKRNDDSHKGSYGKVLLYCGSIGMTGAAIMATIAAMRCGAGLTTLASVKDVAYMAAPQLMEATTLVLPQNKDGSLHEVGTDMLLTRASKSDVVVAGCGISTYGAAKNTIHALLQLKNPCKMVLDADGINCLEGNIDILKEKAEGIDLVITPHPGEMARLCGMTIEQVESDRVGLAKRIAAEYGITVVLKGTQTVIAGKNGISYLNRTGNSALAKGGSGDVLSGMIGGFCALGMTAADAAAAAVYLHGLTADELAKRYSKHGILARDILDEIPLILKSLDR